MAVQFDPSVLLAVNAPEILQDFTYCQNALSNRSLQTTNRDSQHFFLNKWMFEKEIREQRREKCCNKEAVNGACF